MFEEKTLYKNYSAKGSSSADIRSRHDQRKNWIKKYKKDGSCKQLLIDAGILKNE